MLNDPIILKAFYEPSGVLCLDMSVVGTLDRNLKGQKPDSDMQSRALVMYARTLSTHLGDVHIDMVSTLGEYLGDVHTDMVPTLGTHSKDTRGSKLTLRPYLGNRRNHTRNCTDDKVHMHTLQLP